MAVKPGQSSSRRRRTSLVILALQFAGAFVQLIALASSASDKDLILTSSQKATLDKFKQRMLDRLPHDYMKQDLYLVRFLRAKNYNIDLAEQMLSENLKWRKAQKMDQILQEDWNEIQDKYPFYLGDTFAKNGNPILSANFGDWDLRAVSLSGKMPRLTRYLDRGMEEATTLIRKMQSQGKNVTQFDFLVNLDNYNLVQHGCLQCLGFYIHLVNSYENHFPGTTEHIVLFNTPPVFETVLKLLRPLLSPITREAVKVRGQSKETWSKLLLDIADKNQLAPEYGGTYKRQLS